MWSFSVLCYSKYLFFTNSIISVHLTTTEAVHNTNTFPICSFNKLVCPYKHVLYINYYNVLTIMFVKAYTSR